MRDWGTVKRHWDTRTCLEGCTPYLDHLLREGKRFDGGGRTLAFVRSCLLDPSAAKLQGGSWRSKPQMMADRYLQGNAEGKH